MNSINWLFESLWDAPKDKFTWESIRKKAEEMHKQEIIDAYFGGLNGSINDYSESKQVGSEIIDIKYGKGAEHYYNETFKKD